MERNISLFVLLEGTGEQFHLPEGTVAWLPMILPTREVYSNDSTHIILFLVKSDARKKALYFSSISYTKLYQKMERLAKN